MPDQCKLAWDIFTELRKETLESQKIRAQVIGFKITFVSTAIGLIVSKEGVPSFLLVIPALAAFCFDLLIASYSFSIHRIGHYCRTQIERRIRDVCDVPPGFMLWHEFLQRPEVAQNLAQYGNLGITFLAVIPAAVALFSPYRPWLSTSLLTALIVLCVWDFVVHRPPQWKSEFDRRQNAPPAP